MCAETNMAQSQQKWQKVSKQNWNDFHKKTLWWEASPLSNPPSPLSFCTHPHNPQWAPLGPWNGASLRQWRWDLAPSASGQGRSYADCHWCVALPLWRLADSPQWPRPPLGNPAHNALPRWPLSSRVSWQQSPKWQGGPGKGSSHPNCRSCSCT